LSPGPTIDDQQR